MTRTPDEIKKGVEIHFSDMPCAECPYYAAGGEKPCESMLLYDVFSYSQQLETEHHQLLTKNQQLERERDALMHWAKGRCDTCAYNDDCVKHDPDPEGLIVHWYDDCESWEWCGVKEE